MTFQLRPSNYFDLSSWNLSERIELVLGILLIIGETESLQSIQS